MFHYFKKFSFLTGLCIGVLLAILLKSLEKVDDVKELAALRPFKLQNYKNWFKKSGLIRRPLDFDVLRYKNKSYFLESNYLYEKVDVLCVILVKTPKNGEAAQATWAKHCNRVTLINLSVEKRKIPIKRNKLGSSWVLLCKILKEVPEEYKWILVVYDYTFVLLENLRLFLASLNPDAKYYLGHAVKFWSTVYNMGQAGYVLSRGSLSLLKQKLNYTNSCSNSLTYMNQEDYYLGKNLALLNVTPADTRDDNGLSTFHPYNLYHVFFPGENYYKFSIYPHKCCSPHSIAFQSIEGDKMYTYYYLLYTLQLFYDGNLGNKRPSKPSTDEEIWKNFLKVRDIPTNITAQQYYKIWENIVDEPTSFAKHMKREESFDYFD